MAPLPPLADAILLTVAVIVSALVMWLMTRKKP